jgi:hypothetical protein
MPGIRAATAREPINFAGDGRPRRAPSHGDQACRLSKNRETTAIGTETFGCVRSFYRAALMEAVSDLEQSHISQRCEQRGADRLATGVRT